MKKWLKVLLIILSVVIVCGLIIFFIARQDIKSYDDLDKYEEYLSDLRNN